MKNIRLLLSCLLFTLASTASSTTYFVRADGGTRYSSLKTSGQCNGQYNASYASTGGTGVNQNCAFNDARYLWTDGSYTTSNANNPPAWGWIGTGGDHYSIADGPWRVGQSGPNAGDWFGLNGNPYGAGAPVPPSGTAGNPTTIYGVNSASCTATETSPGNATQLFGGYAVGIVLNLSGASYVNVSCLEITDHGDCVKTSSASNKCNTNYPLSDFADAGIGLHNTTTNVNLTRVYIHGLTSEGILGSTGDAVTFSHVGWSDNAAAGWNADSGDGTTGTGTLTVTNYAIIGNGCSEEYPIVHSFPIENCQDDSSGGYGDGFGTATVASSPAWHINFGQGVVAYNTQDGIDGLHANGMSSTITVDRTLAYGNMGNQIKTGADGGASITNSVIMNNCQAMTGAVPGTPSGYNTALSDFCRAGNEAILLATTDGHMSVLAGNTIYGANYGAGGDLGGITCVSSCSGTNQITYADNVLVGFDPNSTGNFPNQYTSSAPTNPFSSPGSIYRNNLHYHLASACPDTGETNSICGTAPQLVSVSYPVYGYANVQPVSGTSNVLGAGYPISGLTLDFAGASRPSPPSIGAYQYGGVVPPVTVQGLFVNVKFNGTHN